jgi:hypothetical protein
MRRIQRYHILSVLGDLKAHPYDQVIMIGSLHFANPINRSELWPGEKLSSNQYYSNVFESMLKKLMEDGLIKRVENDRIRQLRLSNSYQISPRDWDLQLTDKGQDCLRNEQMERAGDYDYYKNFQGTLDSAKKINPGLFK